MEKVQETNFTKMMRQVGSQELRVRIYDKIPGIRDEED
jgi:hypothetical protein